MIYFHLNILVHHISIFCKYKNFVMLAPAQTQGRNITFKCLKGFFFLLL